MKVLIACEESQEVCKAFRAKGHEAYSCDIQMCSGGHPEWHILGDALAVINGNADFTTCDGQTHTVDKWDLLIAHPPCTYLSNAGAARLYKKMNGKSYVDLERFNKGKDAKDGITMEFDVDSRKFPGKRIVVFEVLYLGLIDAHRDLRNQEQTVSILKKEEVTVKTGDNKVYMKQTILIMSASVCILYATWKRKKRRH